MSDECIIVSRTRSFDALSSKGTHGPPNGHPVPVAMSIWILFFLPSACTKRSISIHCGDRNSMLFLSLLRTPYIGVISSAPIPQSAYCFMFHEMFSLSIADPSHHHLAPGFVVSVLGGVTCAKAELEKSINKKLTQPFRKEGCFIEFIAIDIMFNCLGT